MPIFARFGVQYKRPDGGTHYQAASGVECLVYLGCFLLLLVVVYPMFGFLIISANSRAEDLLMSQAIGLERPFSVPEHIGWGWILLLLLLNWIGKYTPLAFVGEVDDAELGKSILKSLLITPVTYFVLPAWVVFFYTSVVVWTGLLTIVSRLRR